MTGWRRIVGWSAVGSVAAAAAAMVIAAGRWQRVTERRVAQLASVPRPHASALDAPPFSRQALDDLPTPVARYFAFALPEGQPRVRSARVRWTGEMQLRSGGGWTPFTAEQHFTASPPGFVWDAEVRMLSLVPVRVRDGYVAGEGTMLGKLGGLVAVVDQGGTREMAESALARWLGEAVWLPTALLPGESVTWTAVDDRTAQATVSDGTRSVSAEFHFAPGGEITRMSALRYRDVNGTAVLTPFEGRYGRYVNREGMMIPISAEVAWLLPEGPFAYWRGRPASVVYKFAGGEPQPHTAPDP